MTASLCSMEMVDAICDTMETSEVHMTSNAMEHMNHQMDDTSSHTQSHESKEHCDMAIDCECEIDTNKQAVISSKSFAKVIPTRFLINYQIINDSDTSSQQHYNLALDESYSPPPLFLANETFLI